jgi:acyl CoA:acetate/3-ketoacid CoA transferase beta subunit
MVITELAVLEMDHGKRRFVLKETAPGVTVEEVLAKTKAEVLVPQSVGTVACS